jgi:hypothetical protein
MDKHENEPTTEHLPGAGDQAVEGGVMPGEADARLRHFQERQRTLSVKDAMKESWKAVAWCECTPICIPSDVALTVVADPDFV